MKSRNWFRIAVTPIFVIGLVVLVFNQRQNAYDWYRLREYTPPASIAALADATTMTDEGKKLFYIHRPELNDRQAFNQNCTDSEESIVLGCYIQNRGIYLYDVNDNRLNGIEEVTAAHEMLHAAYDRLSSNEKERIDALTLQAYQTVTDERILRTVNAYAEKDPTIVASELHSIIGTEIRTIPAELEEYYRRYFTDRQRVVSFSEKYENEFAAREAEAARLRDQLENLKAEIEQRNDQLSRQVSALNQEYSQLQADRSMSEPESFNQRVRIYNEGVSAYNSAVDAVSQKIETYNALVEKYNAVVIEERELIQAIDSRPATIESQ